MKEKVKYTITIVISIAIGVIGTLLTLNYCGLFEQFYIIINVNYLR